MIKKLEDIIGYRFNDVSLLETAMLHRSAANEEGLKRIDSNERLEFLGDAVLELVSSNYLLKKYPDEPEGELTKKRASMVCEKALAYCAKQMGLPKFIRLGKGEEKTGGRNRASITSDAMEALIGAIYEDSGFNEASKFIVRFILDKQEETVVFSDSKTVLQERVQEQKNAEIQYKVLSATGPDHDRTYEVVCIVNGRECETGSGHTKKEAEQEAAFRTIKKYYRE